MRVELIINELRVSGAAVVVAVAAVVAVAPVAAGHGPVIARESTSAGNHQLVINSPLAHFEWGPTLKLTDRRADGKSSNNNSSNNNSNNNRKIAFRFSFLLATDSEMAASALIKDDSIDHYRRIRWQPAGGGRRWRRWRRWRPLTSVLEWVWCTGRCGRSSPRH